MPGEVQVHYPASARVLTNTYLLHDIFTYSEAYEERRSFLLACTTVCRPFYHSAIRLLWSNLVTLLPLWHLLAPPSASCPFDFIGMLKKNDILVEFLQKVRFFFRAIPSRSLMNFQVSAAQLYLDPIRWSRFLWHAALVRQIFHYSSLPGTCDATRSLIQAVFRQNGRKPILPHLRTIEWSVDIPVRDDAFIILFSPSLLCATLKFSGSHDVIDEAEIARLLRRLRVSSPFLEKLAVFLRHRRQMLGLGPVRELVEFSRLHDIHVSKITPATFRAIVAKPNLTSFECPCAVDEVTGSSVKLGSAISVPDLCKLTVRGRASAFQSLFSLHLFPALQSAVFSIDGPPLLQGIAQMDIATFLALFYKTISNSKSLQSFNLFVGPRAQKIPQSGHEPSLREVLAPVLSNCSLRSFRLTVMDDLVSLNDADICALAAAWPGLEALHLAPRGFTSESGISINAVHHLYTHCPRLAELSIPTLRWPLIGVHSIPSPSSALDSRPVHPLWCFYVPPQDITAKLLPLFGVELSDEAAEAMARYLLDLFPLMGSESNAWVYEEMVNEARNDRDQSVTYLRPPRVRLDDRWSRVVQHILSIKSAPKEP